MEQQHWVTDVQVCSEDGVSPLWQMDVPEAKLRILTLSGGYKDTLAKVGRFIEEKQVRLLWLDKTELLTDYFKKYGYDRELAVGSKSISEHRPCFLAQIIPVSEIIEENNSPNIIAKRIYFDDVLTESKVPLWALIDGVNAQEFVVQLTNKNYAESLYTSPDINIRDIGPWIVSLDEAPELLETLKAYPQDQHCFFFNSYENLKNLQAHFRKFTMVWTPNNREMKEFFRFYDPRVYIDVNFALEESKFLSLSKPIERALIPVSPNMYFEDEEDTSFLKDADAFQGDYYQLSFHDRIIQDENIGRGFAIGYDEYNALGKRQFAKGQISIARWLHNQYKDEYSDEAIVRAAFEGSRRAISYDIKAERSVRIYCKCYLLLGKNFEQNEEVKIILNDENAHGIHKANRLSAWLQQQNLNTSQIEEQKLEALPEWLAKQKGLENG